MEKSTRRDFIKTAASGAFIASLGFSGTACEKEESKTGQKKSTRFDLGMASYTFRSFNVDDTIAMTKRLGLKRICFKSFHLPLESSVEEIQSIAAKVRDTGLDLYGCGVVYMTDEEDVDRAFRYAQAAGMRIIVGVPEHELLGYVDQKVKEFDIKLAIHNHGPGDDKYPSPDIAYEKIKELDRRIGLCLDIGHTKRYGLDPTESAEKFADRLLDVHIKDVSAAVAEGNTIEIGRGVIDIPGFLRIIKKIDYQGVLSFEFEKDADDPLPGVAESVGYVNGVLSVI